MPPQRIPAMLNDIENLDKKVEQRHEENEHRFDKLENRMAEISGEIKVMLALLAANVVLNFASLFQHH